MLDYRRFSRSKVEMLNVLSDLEFVLERRIDRW